MMCSRLGLNSLSKSNFFLQPKKKILSFSSSSSQTIKMSQTIEHIVLFKVKPNTDQTKITTMINSLNSLNSLDHVLHLSAGPIYKNRSSSYDFTHMLHGRYASKQELVNYSEHPEHMGIVKGIVNPICDDVMAVDWVANVVGPVVIRPGAVMRFNILKLKEGVGENEKEQVLKVIGEVKEHFGSIEQISYGENFQIARGKGFSIASLAVFPGLEELEEVDKNEEVVKEHKEKVRELLDGVIVLDYVVHTPQSANL